MSSGSPNMKSPAESDVFDRVTPDSLELPAVPATITGIVSKFANKLSSGVVSGSGSVSSPLPHPSAVAPPAVPSASTPPPSKAASPGSGFKRRSGKKRCKHGRPENGYLCKECPGKGICEHKRQKYQCKECKGSSLCKHNKQRHQCKDPVCVQIREARRIQSPPKRKKAKRTNSSPKSKKKLCVHGRAENGYLCKECPGKGICIHGRQKYQCKDCGGSSICVHKKQRHQCAQCKPLRK